MAIAYQALSSEQKIALSQRVPPRTGETLEAWYARATGGAASTTLAQRPGTVQPPSIQATPEVGVTAIPAALAAALPAGLAGVAAALGGAYGLAQMAGVQFPWETGPGEGFIAPWTREIVQQEQGLWVTRETRPELFGAPSTAMVPAAGAAPGAIPAGPAVVKTWTANGWPFAMTSDGKIHTVTKSGVRKSWKPYKSVVLGKKVNSSMAKRAVRKLQSIVQLGKDIEKLGGTRVVYRKKK